MKMEKKYEFTGETMYQDGVTVRRIRAVRKLGFGTSCGAEGGWIETEENLSHDGRAWISDNAIARGKSRVEGNAIVSDEAIIKGSAIVKDNAQVSGNAVVDVNAIVEDNARMLDDSYAGGNSIIACDAIVSGSSRIYGGARILKRAIVKDNAWIYGKARLSDYVIVGGNVKMCDHSGAYGQAMISGKVRLSDNVSVGGNAKISGHSILNLRGDARIGDNAVIRKSSDVLTMALDSGFDDFVTFYRTDHGMRVARRSCDTSTLDEFFARVHGFGNDSMEQVCRLLAEAAKIQILGGESDE